MRHMLPHWKLPFATPTCSIYCISWYIDAWTSSVLNTSIAMGLFTLEVANSATPVKTANCSSVQFSLCAVNVASQWWAVDVANERQDIILSSPTCVRSGETGVHRRESLLALSCCMTSMMKLHEWIVLEMKAFETQRLANDTWNDMRNITYRNEFQRLHTATDASTLTLTAVEISHFNRVA